MKKTSRRDFVYQALALAGASALPSFWLSRAQAAGGGGQMVFIFLRGGADALGLISPSGDDFKALKKWRPNTSLASPIDLTANLVAHARLAPLLSDADLKANLNFIPHVGSLNETRSHFEQMARVESGDAIGSTSSGFLARAAVALGRRQTFAIANGVPASLRGTNPLVIQDPAKLQAQFTFSSWQMPFTRAQRLGMYKIAAGESGDADIDKVARIAQSQFDALDTGKIVTAQDLVSAGNYMNKSLFGQRLAVAAAMLDSAANPAFIAVDAEQLWDTHAAQQTNDLSVGAFGAKVDDLAKNLLAFKNDLVKRRKWATTTVVLISEFGRTIKENGDHGTDHGRGGIAILMGAGVKSFTDKSVNSVRAWSLPDKADSSTALDVKHDYRLILAEILQKRCGMSQSAVVDLFLGKIKTGDFLNLVAG
jgi:uncharacterized protein (DUF1501 family)